MQLHHFTLVTLVKFWDPQLFGADGLAQTHLALTLCRQDLVKRVFSTKTVCYEISAFFLQQFIIFSFQCITVCLNFFLLCQCATFETPNGNKYSKIITYPAAVIVLKYKTKIKLYLR